MLEEKTQLRPIGLNSKREMRKLCSFLEHNDLEYEHDAEYLLGIYDDEDALLACGGCTKNVLKYFCVAQKARNNNFLGLVLTELIKWQYAQNRTQLFVYTKKENGIFFENNGFYLIENARNVALYENSKDGIERYIAEERLPKDMVKDSACLVMNCNPFTLGHKHIIEYAAAQCEILHIFLVEEDASVFPFTVRMQLLQQGTAHIPNIRIHSSGPYIISMATFPKYFLKDQVEAQAVCTELDVLLFAKHIAPAFSITKRFVGQEPYCTVTKTYNETMAKVLPQHGIQLIELPRIMHKKNAISASLVRKHIQEHGTDASLLSLVPQSTLNYLHSPEAIEILQNLQNVTLS